MNELPVGGPTQPDRDKTHAVFNLDIFIIQPTAQFRLQLRCIKNILHFRYYRYFIFSKYSNHLGYCNENLIKLFVTDIFVTFLYKV